MNDVCKEIFRENNGDDEYILNRITKEDIDYIKDKVNMEEIQK